MREQQQSKTFKYGEGDAHRKGRERLMDILRNDGWQVFADAKLNVAWSFDSQNGESLKYRQPLLDYYHEYDTYARKEHSKGRYGTQSELIVEIDGVSHERRIQQNRDKNAERYANFLLPDCKFKRIDISLLLNPNIADKNILELLK